MSEKVKVIGKRFLKAFLAGAFASVAGIAIITFQDVHTWSGLFAAFSNISLVGIMGGITGVVMAGEKWANWKDTPPPPATE